MPEEEDLSRLTIERTEPAVNQQGKRARRFTLLIRLALAALAGGLALAFIFSSALEVETTQVTMAYPSQAFAVLNATGYVVAQRKAEVASKGTGHLEWLGVQEGSVVKNNEILARLENGDVVAEMEKARANVQVANANLEQQQAEWRDAEAALRRAADLVNRKFISPSTYDTALARYDKAQAAVQSAKAAVGAARAALRGSEVAVEYTLIRAPFDGVVLSKHANIGDVITPFTSAIEAKGAVVTMADMDTLEVEADVSESNLGKVTIGQPGEIQLDALPDIRLRGEVHRIVPTVDRSKATVIVKVKFIDRDTRVLPDMSAKVVFLSKTLSAEQNKPVIAVKADSVISERGKNAVFLIERGTAQHVEVDTGDTIGELIEIRHGLKFGDTVVLSPPEGLDDGTKVKPITK
ncbi:MAG: efflux RND transporter periplasmic adaptor subunit [Burkholderiales bacterium]